MKRQTRHFPIVVEIKKFFPEEDRLHKFLSIQLTEVEIIKSLDSRRKIKEKSISLKSQLKFDVQFNIMWFAAYWFHCSRIAFN